MTFTGEEMSLDIPEGGLSLESGWNIKPLNFKVVIIHEWNLCVTTCQISSIYTHLHEYLYGSVLYACCVIFIYS